MSDTTTAVEPVPDVYDAIAAARAALRDGFAKCSSADCAGKGERVPVQIIDRNTPVQCGLCGEPCAVTVAR